MLSRTMVDVTNDRRLFLAADGAFSQAFQKTWGFGKGTYTGCTLNGKSHGPGAGTVLGMHFEGNWKLGNLEGCNGTFYDNATTESYDGCWHKSLYNGIGTYKDKSGNHYNGEFLDGLEHGNGSYYSG